MSLARILFCIIFSSYSVIGHTQDRYHEIEKMTTDWLVAKKFEKVKLFTDSIKEASVKDNDPTLMFFSLIISGNLIKIQKFNSVDAFKYYFDALKLIDENKNIDEKYYVNLYNTISEAYNISHDHDQAIEYGKMALKI